MLRTLLLASTLVAVATREVQTFGQMPATKVVVAEAREVEAPRTITVVGTVGPARRSKVCSEIAGLVAEMPGREGDFIPTRGRICALDTDTLTLQLAEEQAKLGALEAYHQELVAGTRKEELARLKALRDEAAARYDRWEFEMQRIKRLYAGRDSNDKEYYDTKAEFLAAERRKIAAEAAYNLGVEGPRKETIARAAHEVREQKAAVLRVETALEKATIRAPFNGYIVERMAEVGEWIPVGGPVAEMVDLNSVLVRVDVPESALPFLLVDDPVPVKVDALKRSFTGRVKHIMRQADPSARTFPVEIEVPNTEGLLAGGMFARATVASGPLERAVAVPKDAIVEKQGVVYVGMVMPGGDGHMAGVLSPVTVGAEVGEWITITSANVRPGMQMITRGTERLLPFPMPVEIVDEKGTPVAMPAGGKSTPRKEGT